MRKLTLTALVILFATGNAYAQEAHSIPEPSTLLLLATGLGAMAWRFRKRS